MYVFEHYLTFNSTSPIQEINMSLERQIYAKIGIGLGLDTVFTYYNIYISMTQLLQRCYCSLCLLESVSHYFLGRYILCVLLEHFMKGCHSILFPFYYCGITTTSMMWMRLETKTHNRSISCRFIPEILIKSFSSIAFLFRAH